MRRLLEVDGVVELSTWAACALAALAALVVIVAPIGGTNRVLGVAVPMAVASAAAAANALTQRRVPLLVTGILFAVSALALVYGLILTLSLPLRLAVEGICPASATSCPLGFERPATAGENFAVYAATTLGVLAFLVLFVGVEARFFRRTRIRG